MNLIEYFDSIKHDEEKFNRNWDFYCSMKGDGFLIVNKNKDLVCWVDDEGDNRPFKIDNDVLIIK